MNCLIIKKLSYLIVVILTISMSVVYGRNADIFEPTKEGENISHNKIYVGKGKELALTYNFENLLQGYSAEIGSSDGYILLSDGDLSIDGNFFLDDSNWIDNKITTNIKTPDNALEEVEIIGVVVLGNLNVNGSIINMSGDDGLMLLVKGDLRARNLIAGGSFISISGNTIVDEVIYAYYNHGSLYGYGDVQATVFINDDHGTVFYGESNIVHAYGDNHIESTEEMISEHNDEYRITPSLQSLLREDIIHHDEILEYLIDGCSILKDSRYIQPLPEILDQQFFNEKLERLMQNKQIASGSILQRIPMIYRDEILSKKAVGYDLSNIEFMPEALVTESFSKKLVKQSQNDSYLMQFIPEKFKTRALCMEAAQNSSLSITDVPKHLLKDEALMMEIVRYNAWEYRNLSEKFAVKETFMLLAIEGGEYSDVLDVLAMLDDRYPDQDISNQVIIKALDNVGLDLLEKLPSKAVTTKVFEYAKDKFHTLDRWDSLVKEHSIDFWQMYNYQMLDEISNDINHEARYYDALDIVWSSFWTDEFLINVLKYTKPYAALEEIPYVHWTAAFVEAAKKYDQYGYYKEHIEDYEQWKMRKAKPAFINTIISFLRIGA